MNTHTQEKHFQNTGEILLAEWRHLAKKFDAELRERDAIIERFGLQPSKWHRQPWRMARDVDAQIEYIQLCQKRVGKGGTPHVSEIARASRAFSRLATKNWLENTRMVSDEGNEIKMSEVAKTPSNKAAKLCAVLSGIDKFARAKGLIPVATTVTTPPRFHANPQNEAGEWDGSSPSAGHDYLKDGWADFGKRSKKILGFRAVESQKDGTEHWHMLHFVKDPEAFKKAIEKSFKIESEHQIKFDVLSGKSASARASSYVMKYAFKSVSKNFDGCDRAGEDEAQWRHLWNVRGYQFSGLPRGALTIWDEFRRVKNPTFLGYALYAWAAATEGDFCEFLTQLEQAEEAGEPVALLKTRRATGTVKIEGLLIEQKPILTHEKKWVQIKKPQPKSVTKPTSWELGIINQEGTRTPAHIREAVPNPPTPAPKPQKPQIFCHCPGIRPHRPGIGASTGGWYDLIDLHPQHSTPTPNPKHGFGTDRNCSTRPILTLPAPSLSKTYIFPRFF
jgi:hypothetical protein